MGFSNSILGGVAKLIRSAIQSPNFVHGSTGWSINKDGSAEFNSILVPAGTSVTIFVQSTTPTANATGDLWFDTGNGLRLNRWNGSAWVAFQIGTNAIASGSIVSGLIAANAIIAGLVAAGAIDGLVINGVTINGNTINAADINITAGAGNALLVYGTGAPAFKQAILNAFNNSPSGTSQSFTVTKATTTGDAVFVTVGIASATTDLVTGVTDSKSNTYTKIQSEPGASNGRVYQFIALNATALTTSDTITVSYSSAPSSSLSVQACELTGVATASATDKTAVGNGTGDVSISTGTLSASPELVIGSWANASGTFVIDDSVFAAAVPQAGNALTTWAQAPTTASLTNTVRSFVVLNTDHAGALVSLKSAGAPVLIASVAGAAGTDQYGNSWVANIASYSSGIEVILGQPGVVLTWTSAASSVAVQEPGSIQIGVPLANSSKPNLLIEGPTANASLVMPQILMEGTSQDGTGTADILIKNSDGSALPVTFSGQVSIPAGDGPFISGEGWHSVSLPGNMTGTIRVKLLPWNRVALDVDVTYTVTAGGTTSGGALPSSAYYPASKKVIPLSHTGVPTALGGSARIIIPTSGNISFTFPTWTGANCEMSATLTYPLD